MVGCVGLIGFVFMPSDDYVHTRRRGYVLDGHECQADVLPDPFGPGVLLDVNSVAAIIPDNTPMSADAITAHLSSFPPVSSKSGSPTDGCKAIERQALDVPWNTMKAGAKVKILGYQTFVSQIGETGSAGAAKRHDQLLFALVAVKSDTQ